MAKYQNDIYQKTEVIYAARLADQNNKNHASVNLESSFDGRSAAPAAKTEMRPKCARFPLCLQSQKQNRYGLITGVARTPVNYTGGSRKFTYPD